jgi:hypothetical protein
MTTKVWFSAQELADLRLPGLPGSKRKVNLFAETMGWRDYSPAKARPRKGRGGGMEYHISILPSDAKLALLKSQSAATYFPVARCAHMEAFSTAAHVEQRRGYWPARLLLWAISKQQALLAAYLKGGRDDWS